MRLHRTQQQIPGAASAEVEWRETSGQRLRGFGLSPLDPLAHTAGAARHGSDDKGLGHSMCLCRC